VPQRAAQIKIQTDEKLSVLQPLKKTTSAPSAARYLQNTHPAIRLQTLATAQHRRDRRTTNHRDGSSDRSDGADDHRESNNDHSDGTNPQIGSTNHRSRSGNNRPQAVINGWPKLALSRFRRFCW